MKEKEIDSSLLDKAICFAVKAHANTERRGHGFPYVIHPMEAVSIVATITTDQELLAAAALHDVVEDAGVTVEELRGMFGDRVARLVEDETSCEIAGVSQAESWRMRKQHTLDHLAEASMDAKIVAMGDKLSNIRIIYRDAMTDADALWSRFHSKGGKEDQAWYYRGLAESLKDLADTFAYKEFTDLIDKVF